jgi:hypothetical protein
VKSEQITLAELLSHTKGVFTGVRRGLASWHNPTGYPGGRHPSKGLERLS